MIHNKEPSESRPILQWHTAFQATIQIELEAEKDKLIFEAEHLLGKKPMQIDELIIKVNENESIHKNIGRIFRKYNIIEYKSPDDYLAINDFYKVLGYCCFYQADTGKVCEISPEELTITFICNKYPRKFIKHLLEFWGMEIDEQEKGIYYFQKFTIPVQLIITKELDQNENVWLHNLRNDLATKEEIEVLLNKYRENRHSLLVQAVMNIIAKANWELMKEDKENMCEALMELMADELDAAKSSGIEQGISALIRACRTLRASYETTIQLLMEEFHLSKEEAITSMEKYW